MKLTGKKKIRAAMGGLFILFSLGISFWLVPIPSPPASLTEAEEFPWSLLSLDKGRNLDKALQTLHRHLWGEETEALQASRAAWWRFRGVVRTAEKRVALIESKEGVERFTQGDPLPGGETLHAVHDDHIEVKVGDDIREFRLYDL